MVSSVDGPGPPPGGFLPVPTDGRSAVAPGRTLDSGARGAEAGRARAAGSDAVATPIADTAERGVGGRANPFLDRSETFRRPLLASRPAASFLAQAIGQDGGGEGGRERADLRSAANRYRTVQETVDRDLARRTGLPGIDVVA
jgi:hypothetical protein